MSQIQSRPRVVARLLAPSVDCVPGLPWKTSATFFLSSHNLAVYEFFNNMNAFL